MERLLRPERFEGSRDTTPAQWTHWLRTFTNFVDSITPAPDKLKLLINYIAPEAYSHISDCTTYAAAIDILKTVYVKPTNVVFARHQLATRSQRPDESINAFVHSLKILSKDCEFKQVTADTYTEEAVRDAFITGLTSPNIRQRLLEKDSLTLSEAIQLARSLDSAQRNAEEYSSPTVPGSLPTAAPVIATTDAVSATPLSPTSQTSAAAAAVSKVGTCYFCGGRRHLRSLCPARQSECRQCGKTGHFAKVCMSRNGWKSRRISSTSAAAALASESLAQRCDHCAHSPADDSPVLASVSTPRCSTIPEIF
ncbi:uncharacterized protein LOC123520861 [Portunus trituberculatus]|uniref:uncharacterized protein LOC123520861 n=1 Tax=Portunus trituberculatus TaxID=210409 RepID=UPI001E1CCFD5|nr:uncharacterized protein LOC123520861 [Portunus trituberculatus]